MRKKKIITLVLAMVLAISTLVACLAGCTTVLEETDGVATLNEVINNSIKYGYLDPKTKASDIAGANEADHLLHAYNRVKFVKGNSSANQVTTTIQYVVEEKAKKKKDLTPNTHREKLVVSAKESEFGSEYSNTYEAYYAAPNGVKKKNLKATDYKLYQFEQRANAKKEKDKLVADSAKYEIQPADINNLTVPAPFNDKGNTIKVFNPVGADVDMVDSISTSSMTTEALLAPYKDITRENIKIDPKEKFAVKNGNPYIFSFTLVGKDGTWCNNKHVTITTLNDKVSRMEYAWDDITITIDIMYEGPNIKPNKY